MANGPARRSAFRDSICSRCASRQASRSARMQSRQRDESPELSFGCGRNASGGFTIRHPAHVFCAHVTTRHPFASSFSAERGRSVGGCVCRCVNTPARGTCRLLAARIAILSSSWCHRPAGGALEPLSAALFVIALALGGHRRWRSCSFRASSNGRVYTHSPVTVHAVGVLVNGHLFDNPSISFTLA